MGGSFAALFLQKFLKSVFSKTVNGYIIPILTDTLNKETSYE